MGDETFGSEGALARAFNDIWALRERRWMVGLDALAGLASGFVADRFGLGNLAVAIVAVSGALVFWGLCFAWALLRAPYRQRDEARRIVAALQRPPAPDEVAVVIGDLRGRSVAVAPSVSVGVLDIFVLSAAQLTTGCLVWDIHEIVETLLRTRLQPQEFDAAVENMRNRRGEVGTELLTHWRTANLIDTEARQWKPFEQLTTHTYYKLSDFGAKVLFRLRTGAAARS